VCVHVFVSGAKTCCFSQMSRSKLALSFMYIPYYYGYSERCLPIHDVFSRSLSQDNNSNWHSFLCTVWFIGGIHVIGTDLKFLNCLTDRFTRKRRKDTRHIKIPFELRLRPYIDRDLVSFENLVHLLTKSVIVTFQRRDKFIN
jgi:hypothetical protein